MLRIRQGWRGMANDNIAEITESLRYQVAKLIAPEGTGMAVGSRCPAEGLAGSEANLVDRFESLVLSLIFVLHQAFSHFIEKRFMVCSGYCF